MAKKGDGSWELTEPEVAPADTTKVNDFLEQMCDLRTDQWADDKDSNNVKKALAKTIAKLSLKEGDGNEHVITVGDSVETYHYATVKGDSTIFKFYSYKKDKFLKDWKDFEQPPDTTKADSTIDSTQTDTLKPEDIEKVFKEKSGSGRVDRASVVKE